MKIKAPVFILAIMAALTVSGVALADNVWGSSHEDGIGYHWSADDLTIRVGDQSGIYVPGDLAKLNVSAARLVGVVSSSSFDTVVKDGKMRKHFLGSARIRIDEDGHILEGEVELNTFFYGLDQPWWDVVICQELLHAKARVSTGTFSWRVNNFRSQERDTVELLEDCREVE